MTSSAGNYSATAQDWINGARPHTWANAFAPVIAGTGAAFGINSGHIGRALLALIVAWALIIGVNFANDHSDGIRGTDDDRTGRQRLTGSGLAQPSHVKYAAFGCFAVAGLAGIILSLAAGAWWLILIGALCIAGAWFYTGGKNPYGYRGLGEVVVDAAGAHEAIAKRQRLHQVLLAIKIGGHVRGIDGLHELIDAPGNALQLAQKLGRILVRGIALLHAYDGK